MWYVKICLDDDINTIIYNTYYHVKHWINNVLFYNSLNGKTLNKNKVLKVVSYMINKHNSVKYLFYNVPFCIFDKLWKKFIDKYCVFNRLCNYYIWYNSYGKCNLCDFGLFCNNFNSLINNSEIKELNGFYWEKINKYTFLIKFIKIYNFFIMLWYSDNEIILSSRQKYFMQFLRGAKINKNFLSYLTLTIKLSNRYINYNVFKNKNKIAIFKNKCLNDIFFYLQRKCWINILLECDNSTIDLFESNKFVVNFLGKNLIFLNTWFYNIDPPFFDFDYNNLFLDKNATVFKWVSLNKNLGIFYGNARIVKNSKDFLYNRIWDVYVWKDIFSWVNIESFKAILITSDWSSEHVRLYEIINSIKVPIIERIKPNIVEIIKNGSKLKIDFSTWTINLIKT